MAWFNPIAIGFLDLSVTRPTTAHTHIGSSKWKLAHKIVILKLNTMKTMTFCKTILIITAFFTVSSCQSEKVDIKAEGEKLMQASRDWSKAAEARDVEKTLTYWSDNAIVISAGQPELKGKEAIRGMVEGSIKDPNFHISWEPISVEISENGDMGYLIENSTITTKDSTGKEMAQNFKTVTIWKKQSDGSWKNFVDVMSPEK